MEYIALKKCRISGRSFVKGDVIPAGCMSMYEGSHLESMGVVAAAGSSANADAIVLDDRLPALGKDTIKEVMNILQEKNADVLARISTETDKILLSALLIFDSRRSIQTACSERLAAL